MSINRHVASPIAVTLCLLVTPICGFGTKKNYSTFLFWLCQVAIAPKASRSFDNFCSLYHKTLYSMYTTHVLRSLTSFSLRVAYLQLFFVIHESLWFDVPRIRGNTVEGGISCMLHIRTAYNSDITVIFSGGTRN